MKHPHGRGEDPSGAPRSLMTAETPPRAWGRPSTSVYRRRAGRNTPTGVGKTEVPTRSWAAAVKHPHGRGEDSGKRKVSSCAMETPPRAWGRLCGATPADGAKRNTPTGVGKTRKASKKMLRREKHPHGRGEDQQGRRYRHQQGETPPRAWGRRGILGLQSGDGGNTPTGVGKTASNPKRGDRSGKHPHGRGEDRTVIPRIQYVSETPPRAWGRLRLRLPICSAARNTPTGVGKTLRKANRHEIPQKHPHGRGEDPKSFSGLEI